jgi:hypothetical protein
MAAMSASQRRLKSMNEKWGIFQGSKVQGKQFRNLGIEGILSI